MRAAYSPSPQSQQLQALDGHARGGVPRATERSRVSGAAGAFVAPAGKRPLDGGECRLDVACPAIGEGAAQDAAGVDGRRVGFKVRLRLSPLLGRRHRDRRRSSIRGRASA